MHAIMNFTSRSYKILFALLGAILLFNLFFGLNNVPLESYDESRHGVNAVEALESGTIPWEKGWTTTRLHNPITGTTYTGINRIWLTFASYLKGYKDSRWFTFNEISNEKKFHPGEKWHLKKGAEGVEIKKKPIYYNEVEDKWYNSKQYYKKLATLNDVEKEIFKDELKAENIVIE